MVHLGFTCRCFRLPLERPEEAQLRCNLVHYATAVRFIRACWISATVYRRAVEIAGTVEDHSTGRTVPIQTSGKGIHERFVPVPTGRRCQFEDCSVAVGATIRDFKISGQPLHCSKPFDERLMRRYPVSDRVNNVANNGPDCSEPIALMRSAQARLF